MTSRRAGLTRTITASVIACCFALALGITISSGHPSAAARQPPALRLVQQAPARHSDDHGGTEMVAVTSSLGACEARLEAQPRRVPTLAIVGASYTAGVGPNNPELSWAVELARLLRWNAVIYGDSGAGFINAGHGGHGPVSRMLGAERLGSLAPEIVIIQAGYNDARLPAARVSRHVRATVGMIRQQAPGARIAFITVFTRSAVLGGTAAQRAVDRVIVSAGRAADQRTVIMDPLAGRWRFARERPGGLHPSAAGDAWIAHKVAEILYEHGVRPASVDATVPVICDVSVGVTRPSANTDRDA